MKTIVKKMKSGLRSVLRPNQRRNWHKDQAKHYRYFLDDFALIERDCTAEINGIKIHSLLEKEFRNAYWIYRSSPLEQAVLLSKLLVNYSIDIMKTRVFSGNIEGRTVSSLNPKAIFVVSPATGLASLLEIAERFFEKNEVIFASSGRNSKIQQEILRRQFPLVVASNPDEGSWTPSPQCRTFLKELRGSLRHVGRLNKFQKLFVFLYVRSALKSLIFYHGFFRDNITSSGCQVFTGRPRTPFVNGAILASKRAEARLIFVSHTIWYKLPCPVGQLYDLSVFSGAVLLTKHCKDEVERVSPAVQVAVIGMSKPDEKEATRSRPAKSEGDRLRIGMFLGVNDFITEILPKLAKLKVDIFLKTRPPGRNSEPFAFLQERYENVFICDHAEFSMERFCDSIDVVIGGYSNAVFHAAGLGVPVIGYLTSEEASFNSLLRPALIPLDLAVIQSGCVEDVIHRVEELVEAKGKLPTLSEMQLANFARFIPDRNYSEVEKLLEERGH